MKKVIILTFIILTTSIAFGQGVTVMKKLPSVNIKTLEGQSFNTSQIQNDGKPILISFWALWCKPCKKEMEAYNENYEDWQEETGVKIYAVY